jgi:hypothetical protein
MEGSSRRRPWAANPAVWVVVAVSLVAILAGLASALSGRGRLTEGSNRISEPQFVRELAAGQTFCQPGEIVPADSSRLRFRIGTHGPPGPPLTVRFFTGKKLITRGFLPGGWPQGDIDVPIDPIAKTTPAERMCVHNGGKPLLAFAGERDVVRTDYFSQKVESWWGRFGTLRDRFDEGKSRWFGNWSLVMALLLAAAAGGLAIAVTLRRVR